MQGGEFWAIRNRLDVSQNELAELLGLSRVFVGMMERGSVPIERRTELAMHYLDLVGVKGALAAVRGD